MVQVRFKMGLLTKEQAQQFELMLSRCRQVVDYEQVMAALRHFCGSLQHDTDRYARLMQEDHFEE
jgi:hypothetical protein